MVLLEPAGGQILCAWVALAFVASQRSDDRRDAGDAVWLRFAWASLAAAAAWSLSALALTALVPDGWLAAGGIQAGRELFLGVLVTLPLARAASQVARVSGLVAST